MWLKVPQEGCDISSRKGDGCLCDVCGCPGARSRAADSSETQHSPVTLQHLQLICLVEGNIDIKDPLYKACLRCSVI